MEAGQQAGFPYNPDMNGASEYGVGSYQLTIRDGWRQSAAVAFLRPALGRKNLTVITHAQVSRVIFEHGRATSVEWIEANARSNVHRVHASREIILASGTLQSPQILQLSGIGPAEHLGRQGIDVMVDAPEVGENLKDHYQARTIVRLKRRMSLNDDVRNPLKLAGMGARWLFSSSGPLTVGAGQVGGFVPTKHARGSRADMQFNVMPLSVDKPGEPLHRYSGFTASACQCRPSSKGRVSIRSTDPFADPLIEPNYLAEELDRKTLVAGLRILRDIYSQPAFRDLIDGEVLPGASRQTDAELLEFAANGGGTVFHPVGTCRMGSDARSVVDPLLKVRGVEGLRVIDASVMPDMVSANTNAASIMIGEKGAALVLGTDQSTPARSMAGA
jgi:choline dehydrogenase